MSTHTDETAIRDLLQTMYTAWAGGDAAAFAKPYLDDAVVVMPATLTRGRAQVEKTMAARFAGPMKGSHVKDEVQSIQFLGAEAAVAVSRSWIFMAGGTELPVDREVTSTWVLAKRAGEWKVAVYANAPAPTAS